MQKRCILGLQICLVQCLNGMIESSLWFILNPLATLQLMDVDKYSNKDIDQLVFNCDNWGFYYESFQHTRHRITFDWNYLARTNAHALGILPTIMVSGWLAELYSPCLIVSLGTIFTGLVQSAIPLAYHFHSVFPIVIRFTIGLLLGIVLPSMYKLIASWTPKQEQGKMLATMYGNKLGILLCWLLVRVTVPLFGWQYACFITGMIPIVWGMSFFCIVSDTPQKHSTISVKENNYLRKTIPQREYQLLPSVNGFKECFRRKPPYQEIWCNGPYIAYLFLNVGHTWALFFIFILSPRYLCKQPQMNVIVRNGLFFAIPFCLRFIAAFFFGIIGDFILSRECLSVTTMRKSFSLFSNTIPGFLLLAITYSADLTIWIVLLYVVVILSGASVLTHSVNNLDLSPHHAGTLFGFAFAFDKLFNSILYFVMSMTVDEYSLELSKWNGVLTFCAVWNIFTSIMYCKFGSGDVQPFNEH